ncbi:hypothetical protein ATO46_16435 [Aeromonas schubertii]|nr:hypothetical protein ATO46_16435 [Aeromonas schubertii]
MEVCLNLMLILSIFHQSKSHRFEGFINYLISYFRLKYQEHLAINHSMQLAKIQISKFMCCTKKQSLV